MRLGGRAASAHGGPGHPGARRRDALRLGLPVVAKWSRPWLLPAGSGLRSTQVLHTAREARELHARTAEAGSPLLLQAYLPPGTDRDWFFHGYADRTGTVRAGGPGRKHLSWPRGAGLTAVGRWTPNSEVTALAERITGELGYRGILDLDFRRCGATGRYHLLDFNPRPGAQFRLFTDSAGLDVVRALHADLTGRPLPDGDPVTGRAFVVENYAPLAALRPAPGGRELAWWAGDDRAPGWAMWALWARHVSGRLRPAAGRRGRGPGAAPRAPGSHALPDDRQRESEQLMMYDLLVVGAGPYGLSIASHAAAAGLNLRVFGRTMASWRDHMPSGMFLKSEPWASNLSDPAGRWRLEAYCAERV